MTPLSEKTSFYWSVRRELWENRSLYIAPLLVGFVAMFALAVSTVGIVERRRDVLLLDPAQQRARIAVPYDAAAAVLIITAFIVGIFYCLDALYGERRDRSILFWKSLPVSDRTTVLSKATIPMIVLPAIIFPIIIVTQFWMLLISSAVLASSGLAGTTWTRFNLIEHSLILLYLLPTLALWHAPIYAWLLLVSAWAKRATFLWAVMPFVVVSVFERIAFGTSYFGLMLRYRVAGYTAVAFALKANTPIDSLSQLTPGRFLTTAGLWGGLILTAIFLAAAVRLRRNREPI